MNENPNLVTDEEIEATMQFLVTVYPNQKKPVATLEAYKRALQGRAENGALLYAAETWWAEPRYRPGNQFWPTPADLLEIVAIQGVKPLSPEQWQAFFKPDLAERLQVLKNLFTFEGRLVEGEWKALATEYVHRGGECAAQSVMHAYQARVAMLDTRPEMEFA